MIIKMTNFAYTSQFYNKQPIMGSVLDNNKKMQEFAKKIGIDIHEREENERESQLSQMVRELKEQNERAREVRRLESIAMRIAKGESVTPAEEEELRSKNPEEHRKAHLARSENEDLKRKIENSKSLSEARQHISNHMGKELVALRAKDDSYAHYLREGRLKIEREMLSGKIRINKGLDVDEDDYQKRKAMRMGMSIKEYEKRKKRGEIPSSGFYLAPTIDLKG